jgi:hypothetical protein
MSQQPVIARAEARIVRRAVSSSLATHYGAPDEAEPHVVVALRDGSGNLG